MKRIFITEQQFNTLLNEELGIAKNVIAISDNIEKIVFPFLDSDEMKLSESYYKNPEPFKNGYSKDDKTIYLPFITIDGILSVDNIENTIQHEVEHYWQCKNKKTPLSTNHYQELVSLIDNNNPYISTIAEIIFLSKKFEIDAEINGAFAELKTKTNIKTINDVFRKYRTWQTIRKTKK